MAQSLFSLSWDAHKSNFCTGLSSLQQNGEFVDMTIAADGHHVKVHQIIMALASPYIKELIASAQCPHPVVFLNKISYDTLSAMLEYIYTGEVQVSIENLSELIHAGKELHIKGLEDMDLNEIGYNSTMAQDNLMETKPFIEDEETAQLHYYAGNANDKYSMDDTQRNETTNERKIEHLDDNEFEEMELIDNEIVEDTSEHLQEPHIAMPTKSTSITSPTKKQDAKLGIMQYTVSTQGSLQMILNRFVYYLKFCKRDGTRQWRCVDYLSHIKCPAQVMTKEDLVLQRISAHTHPFHDKKILKKIRAGSIYTAIKEAVKEGNNKKQGKTAQRGDIDDVIE